MKHIGGYGLEPDGNFGLPVDEYDAVMLIKRGFVYEFMRVALVKPLMSMKNTDTLIAWFRDCLLYTSPSPRDRQKSRMPSSA